MKPIKISKYSQLLEYSDRIDDVEYISQINFDLTQLENIKIEVYGDNYNSSITPCFMKAFLHLQKEIYQDYSEFKYGKRDSRCLKDHEKEALKIFIQVDKGSSIFTILLPNLVNLGLPFLADVTKNEIFRNQALITVAVTLTTFFGQWLDSKIPSSKNKESKKMTYTYNRKESKVTFFNLIKKDTTIEKTKISGLEFKEV